MLKQRIITALILVAIVMACLFASNPLYWQGLIILAVTLGFYEWLRFCKVESLGLKAISYLAFAACLYLIKLAVMPMDIVVVLACMLWVVLLIFTVTDALDFLHSKWFKLPIGVMVLSTAGWLIVEFQQLPNGALWLLCFFFSVWAADVGAYFVGKRFGKTKLAPKVSPGKTIEGLLGGLGLVLILFAPILFTQFDKGDAALLLATVLVTAFVSVGGDLFESKLKRYAGLKDSSQILPGHGGVLDRIDSLLAGAPIFAAGLLLLDLLG